MTKLMEAYADTLNLLGSDVLDDDLQAVVDHEHELADPEFARLLKARRDATALVTS